MTRPLCIGLTGGIGSGKTSAGNIFSGLGVPVIDTDAIAREVVQPGRPALQAIINAFGADVVDKAGRLRRAHLRKLVFNDLPVRRKLEAIIHPQVYNEVDKRIGQITFPYCIVSSPLLLESRTLHDMDRILVIDIPEPMQIQRASLRDKSRQDEIKKIVAAQIDRRERLQAADDVIVNDMDLSSLREQVVDLHGKYLAMSSGKKMQRSQGGRR